MAVAKDQGRFFVYPAFYPFSGWRYYKEGGGRVVFYGPGIGDHYPAMGDHCADHYLGI